MSDLIDLINALVVFLQSKSFTSVNGSSPTITRKTVGGSNEVETYAAPVIEVFPFSSSNRRFDRSSYRNARQLRIALVYRIEQENDALRQVEEDAFFEVLEELESYLWAFKPANFSPAIESLERNDIDAEAYTVDGMMVSLIDLTFSRVIDV